MTTTIQLPDDLAALLAAHGIAPTTDALLAEFERRNAGMHLAFRPTRNDRERWRVWTDECYATESSQLTALARAYQAMIEGER